VGASAFALTATVCGEGKVTRPTALNKRSEEMSDSPYKDEADELGVPLIPKRPERAKTNPGPNPIVAVCGECGIKLHQVMGYVCSSENCPIQVRCT
jgi:hypothetical protein